MKMWVDPRVCVDRFLNVYAHLPYGKLNGKSYEDEYCKVECENNIIHAVSYGVSAGHKFKLDEVSVVIW
jgi:hypothetical protein